MSADKDRLKKALDSMIFLPHLKDRQARSTLSSLVPAGSEAGGKGRPWDKGDLFRRLQTFKASTWFAKPDVIGPVECARRGWCNTGVDLLTCESCNAVVSCPIAPQLLPQEAQTAGARYAKQLTESHDAACPWKTTCCSLSLLQFPSPAQGAVLANYRQRCTTLTHITCLPPIDPTAVSTLATSHEEQLTDLLLNGPKPEKLLQTTTTPPTTTKESLSPAVTLQRLSQGVAVQSTTDSSTDLTARIRLLALLGWELRPITTNSTTEQQQQQDDTNNLPSSIGPESACLTCTMCGARAGLWTCFPDLKPQALIPEGGFGGAGGGGIGGDKNKMLLMQRATMMTSPGNNKKGLTPSSAQQLSRHVAVDMMTTIAGGDLQEPSNNNNNNTTVAAVAAPFGRASDDSEPPAFGFAAMKSLDGLGGGGSKLTTPGGGAGGARTKRARDPFWDDILEGSNAGGGGGDGKKAKSTDAGEGKPTTTTTPHGAGVKNTTTVANAVTSPATLRYYRSLTADTLDPIKLHRAFCPWIKSLTATSTNTNSNSTGGDGSGIREEDVEKVEELLKNEHCGWRWFLKQLTHDVDADGVLGGDGGSGVGHEGDGSGGNGGGWDPALLLRNVLHKIEVRK